MHGSKEIMSEIELQRKPVVMTRSQTISYLLDMADQCSQLARELGSHRTSRTAAAIASDCRKLAKSLQSQCRGSGSEKVCGHEKYELNLIDRRAENLGSTASRVEHAMNFRDLYHQMNQKLAASGGRIVMPEGWADDEQVRKLAETMNDAIADEISELDRNPIAQALAAEMVKEHLAHWHEDGNRFALHTKYGDYDESDPTSATRAYLLVTDGASSALCGDSVIPLDNVADWKTVATFAMHGQTGCDALLTTYCERDECATEVLAVKRGEYVCAFKACFDCVDAFKTVAFTDECYIGPFPWYDDYSREPQTDDQHDDDNDDPWS
jgi:hypothetical protein